MTFDPDVKALMLYVKRMGLFPIHKMGVETARKNLDGNSTWDVPRQNVFRYEPHDIPTRDGVIQIRIYWPDLAADEPDPINKEKARLPCLLMFHGGGFVLGDLDSYENSARHYCNMAGIVVVNVGYRLAPEHKFPVAAEDSYVALNWVYDNARQLGIDPERIALTGASAGGILVIIMCLLARDRKGPKIALQIPVIPVLNLAKEATFPSRNDYIDDMADLRWFNDMYFSAEADPNDVRVAPILADNYSDLPPALVITAGHCPMRDEGLYYADRLRAADIDVIYKCYEGANHQAMVLPGMIKAARQSTDLITATLKAKFEC